ncbi:hypothetical protein N7486_002897 [Penicillium sp. IBT 16267x]|nr:hypothetical protein N7486_002897 [Penicillium sp. IBT 16267x]
MAGIETQDGYLDLGGAPSFFRILDIHSQTSSGNDNPEFVLFHMSRKTLEYLFCTTNEESSISITYHCSSYDLTEELFLAKMPTSYEHGAASMAIDTPSQSVSSQWGFLIASTNTAMQLRQGRVDVNKQTMVGAPGDHHGRPTLALEIAYSESESKLQSDVRFWLNPNDSDANICLTLRIYRAEPKIRIEQWECQDGRAYRSQSIWIEKKSSTRVDVTNHPVIIPFEGLFLRIPSTPAEGDLRISRQALENVADKIWDLQGF